MTIKNGDLPAMPVWCSNSDQQLYGITKREQLAMAAMQGILNNGVYTFADCAVDAVQYADALLAELERTK